MRLARARRRRRRHGHQPRPRPPPPPLRARSRSGATRASPRMDGSSPAGRTTTRPPAHPSPLRRCSGSIAAGVSRRWGTVDSTGTGGASGRVGGLALAGKLHLPVRGRPRARGAGHGAGIPTREAPGPPPRNARATDARPRGGSHGPAPPAETRAGRSVPQGFCGGARGGVSLARAVVARRGLEVASRRPRGARHADARRAPRLKKKKTGSSDRKIFSISRDRDYKF